MSPSEFIREVRLKKAVGLLKSDEYNIDEIAIIVGFNSTSYFIRSFKKKYEITNFDIHPVNPYLGTNKKAKDKLTQ